MSDQVVGRKENEEAGKVQGQETAEKQGNESSTQASNKLKYPKKGGQKFSKKDSRPKRDKEEGLSLFNALIELRRVAKTTTGGKTISFSAVMVVGDRAGKVGIGKGKSLSARDAVKKALKKGSQNLQDIKMWNETIPHRCEAKYKSARVLLMSASKGTGIVAGGAVRSIADVAGIKNLRGKSLGSSNKPCVALAALKALSTLRTKKEQEMMLKY
jgi:small subunit ribosomal protein S5